MNPEYSVFHHALSRNNSATGPNVPGTWPASGGAHLHDGQFVTGSAQLQVDKSYSLGWLGSSEQIFYIDQPGTTGETTYDLIAAGSTGDTVTHVLYGTQVGGVSWNDALQQTTQNYPRMQWVSGYAIEIG